MMAEEREKQAPLPESAAASRYVEAVFDVPDDADELTLAVMDARTLMISEYQSMLETACPRDDGGVPDRKSVV